MPFLLKNNKTWIKLNLKLLKISRKVSFARAGHTLQVTISNCCCLPGQIYKLSLNLQNNNYKNCINYVIFVKEIQKMPLSFRKNGY